MKFCRGNQVRKNLRSDVLLKYPLKHSLDIRAILFRFNSADSGLVGVCLIIFGTKRWHVENFAGGPDLKAMEKLGEINQRRR
jgi:hypothetical protein